MLTLPYIRKKVIVPQQILSNKWDKRHEILNGKVNLFCWQRHQNQQITNYLNGIIDLDLPPISFQANKANLAVNLSKARKLWDYKHLQKADKFWIDVYQLVNDFLNFSENNSGKVHLRTVKDNGCIKFHTDGYNLRLFTTYFGPGTEWLPESATNRKELGKSNELIVKDSSFIKQMNAFDVGILKGEPVHNLSGCPGIVHRSPEIETKGEARIILRIDS